MNSHFEEVVKKLLNAIKSELPGFSAQKRLNPLGDASAQVPCYDINGKIIWGATERIIAEFSAIIKRIK